MRACGPIWSRAPSRSAGGHRRLPHVPQAFAGFVRDMPTVTKTRPRKPGRRRATQKVFAHGIKAAPGNPFAGLEPVIGSLALPRDPRPPREIIRARYLADHNT